MLVPVAVSAQDDADPSLGDLARKLRKNRMQQAPQQQPGAESNVIDNDNLAQVMEDAKKGRPIKQDKTVFSIDSASNTVKVSSPDVTCSLSFNAQASSLLIKPVLIEDLPLPELLKIDGPGSIQDEALQLDVFNGTDWEIREITVGLTLERKPGENAEVAARARIIPAAEGLAPATVERRSDVTLLYHLKAEAKPFSTTAFHEVIGITPGPMRIGDGPSWRRKESGRHSQRQRRTLCKNLYFPFHRHLVHPVNRSPLPANSTARLPRQFGSPDSASYKAHPIVGRNRGF